VFWGLAYTLTQLGYEAMVKNDYPTLRAQITEGMAIWRRLKETVCRSPNGAGRAGAGGVFVLSAATALAHGLALATPNTKDFDPFGVPMFDPWRDEGAPR